jgi:hypothetical protein
LNVARQITDRLSERYRREVVDVSRTMTTDCTSLDDVPAVALAFCRTMLSISIESGSAFIRDQMHVEPKLPVGLHARHDRLAQEMLGIVEPILRITHLVGEIEFCDRQIGRLNATSAVGFGYIPMVLAGTAPAIKSLFQDALVWDAFISVAGLQSKAA